MGPDRTNVPHYLKAGSRCRVESNEPTEEGDKKAVLTPRAPRVAPGERKLLSAWLKRGCGWLVLQGKGWLGLKGFLPEV